jgi:phenylacetate-CoA ligase
MGKTSSAYWNAFMETLPRDDLVKIQVRKFREVLKHAIKMSPMYREKFQNLGLNPEDVKSPEDIRKIPCTEKSELRESQECGGPYLYGKTLGTDIESLCSLHQTSGTTGRPVYVPDTYRSWQWRIEPWACMLYMMGFREKDRVFIPFGYNVYVAFWSGHYAAEKLGCEVIPGGALDTRARIQKMMELRASALFNTPTYGLHMAEVAKEMGINPSRDLGIRKMVCAGEPMPEATRRRLEALWSADVYNHIGGAETCGWAGMCAEKKDLHVLEPYFLVEILDRQTLSKPCVAGEEGVAVITPLFYRALPLVRFNTNDVMVLAKGACGCGRTSLRIERILGRSDELHKIRGVLFSPQAVEEIICGCFPDIVEHEIIVTRKFAMDEVTLRVEAHPSVKKDECEDIGKSLLEQIKVKTNLRFGLEWAKPGELPRYTLKAKRFKDLRSQEEVYGK